jgi:Sugar phosphate isomerases/epimerases
MIGVSCTQFAATDPNTVWEDISKHFDHWEIFSEWKNEVSKMSGSFNEKKSSYKMTYSIHAPITDVNIAALNDRIREASVKDMIKTMECANLMEIDTVTVHPGIYSMVLSDVKEESIAHAKRSLKIMEKAAEELSVTLAVENMPSFMIMMGQTPDELSRLIEGTDLKICFDIGHANTMGRIDEFIDRFSGRIANIHIHDNFGDKDSHMTIGDGNIDFAKVLSKLKSYKGNYIIEAKSLASAIESRKKLEKLLLF